MALDLVARLKLDDRMTSPLQRINSHLSRMQSVTDRTSSSVKRFGASFAGIASAIGITAALAGSMMLVKNSIGSAFDRIDTMERFERTMTTMLGTSEKAKAALEGLSAVVDGTAYGLDTAARSVQNFVSRGIEVKKATRWFDAMGDAVAFFGDGSNEQLESVSSAMSKMLSSGKVSMQQMETLYIAGIDGPGIYAKAVGKSTAEVQKALSSGKISAEDFFDVVTTAMLEGTNGVQKIAGTAKDAGATWAGAIANMKFAVVRGVTTIITSLDEMLANNGLPSLRDMVSAFGKKFESVLKSAAGAIQPFIKKVKTIYKALKPYAAIFKEVAIAVGIFVGAMFAVSATLSIISGLAGVLAFLSGPVGIAVLAITGIALAFRAFYKHSEPFRAAVDGVVGAVKGLFDALGNGGSADGLRAMLEAGLSIDQIKRVYEFAGQLRQAFDTVKDAIATGDVTDIAKALGISPEVISSVTSMLDAVKTSFDNIRTTITDFVAAVAPGVESILSTFSGFGDALSSVFTALMGVLEPVFSGIAAAFGILGEAATVVFTNVIVPAVDLVTWAFQTLWQVVGPLLELLGASIELAFTMLKIMWDTIISPFVGFLTGEFATAVSKTTGGVDSIGAAFEFIGGIISTVAGYVKDFASALSNVKIPDWVSSIGGKIRGAGDAINGFMGIGGGRGGAKSNYHGIDYVPYDGYQTVLHKGERVQTAQEVREESGGSGGGLHIAKFADEIIIREEADMDLWVAKIIAAKEAGGK